MENFKVYYINLAHRSDRLQIIQNSLNRAQYPIEKATRVEAVYDKVNGTLGCARSHLKTLRAFLADKEAGDICVIFEDDARADCDFSLEELIRDLHALEEKWDVVLLGSYCANRATWTDSKIVYTHAPTGRKMHRTYRSGTTHAYAVRRDYIPTLIETFERSESALMKLVPHKKDAEGRSYQFQRQMHAIDTYWQVLQKCHTFYNFTPNFFNQAESYSDVEYKNCNYGKQ